MKGVTVGTAGKYASLTTCGQSCLDDDRPVPYGGHDDVKTGKDCCYVLELTTPKRWNARHLLLYRFKWLLARVKTWSYQS